MKWTTYITLLLVAGMTNSVSIGEDVHVGILTTTTLPITTITLI